MKKSTSTTGPLRRSISVSVSQREFDAFVRLGNKYGSRAEQVRECLDLNKVEEKIRESETSPGGSACVE